MRPIIYLTDNLFRHQKKLEMVAVFLLFLTISFRFTNLKTAWVWNDHIYMAVLLVFVLILIAWVWMEIEKKKTSQLIAEIKNETPAQENDWETRLLELSARQRDVFELIAAGKSNKEIMDELNIELSTLKTHINKIYKTLDIKSRREVRKHRNL